MRNHEEIKGGENLDLPELKEALLGFLGEVTTIREKARDSILNRNYSGFVQTKNGECVISDFLLFKESRLEARFEVDENKRDTIHIALTATLFTERHKYSIYAHHHEGRTPYLGAGVSNRTPRAGEDWMRGNDLPDGDFSRETWDAIKRAIIKNEMVALSDYIKRHDAKKDICEEATEEE